ncbi:hypothetical protein [Haliangium sp.]|uniref:hypothetical protein n=1 Tax=Haliangium sp. TaxID=2663208 RepID=UPI003D100617
MSAQEGWYLRVTKSCVGKGGVAYDVVIMISNEAWRACNPKLKNQVNAILEAGEIKILTGSDSGNGLKWEPNLGGFEFHTQSDKRLQAPDTSIKAKTIMFTRCRKGAGH